MLPKPKEFHTFSRVRGQNPFPAPIILRKYLRLHIRHPHFLSRPCIIDLGAATGPPPMPPQIGSYRYIGTSLIGAHRAHIKACIPNPFHNRLFLGSWLDLVSRVRGQNPFPALILLRKCSRLHIRHRHFLSRPCIIDLGAATGPPFRGTSRNVIISNTFCAYAPETKGIPCFFPGYGAKIHSQHQ